MASSLGTITCTGDRIQNASHDQRPSITVATRAVIEPPPQPTITSVEVAAAAAGPSACPSGMTLVEGEYCSGEVEHVCKRWLDPPGRYHLFRCEAYEQPAKCKGQKKKMRYCIDTDEARLAGSDDPRPSNHVSYVEAKRSCSARGAHVCNESEWQFACEGEEMRPYPYGFTRDPDACNIDNFELGKGVGRLVDKRSKQGENEKCVSPFGVRDMAGNLEEWTTGRPGTHTHWTLLKGSWWLPGRSTCRATNAGHDEVYQGTETGFRCCK